MSAAAARQSSVSTLVTNNNTVEFAYKSIAEAFPDVNPGLKPLGTVGIFQIRHAKRQSAGGVLLVDETRSTEYYNTQVAKVVALGPLCFKNLSDDRRELIEWPEGPWFKPGDFVRVPKYGGDRFDVPYEHEVTIIDALRRTKKQEMVKDSIIFAVFKVKDILGVIDGDPLTVKTFLD